MDWGILILDIIVTVFLYLLVPIICCIRHKPMTKKQIRRIIIANAIVVWLFFRILISALGGEPTSSAAVFLWSWVGHMIMKRVLLRDTESEEFTYVCQFCGHQQKVDFEICPRCGKNTNQDECINAEKKEETNETVTPTFTMPEGVTHICLSDSNDISKKTPGLTYGSDILLQPQTTTNFQNKNAFCRRCGNKLLEDSMFCNKCGTKVINEE